MLRRSHYRLLLAIALLSVFSHHLVVRGDEEEEPAEEKSNDDGAIVVNDTDTDNPAPDESTDIVDPGTLPPTDNTPETDDQDSTDDPDQDTTDGGEDQSGTDDPTGEPIPEGEVTPDTDAPPEPSGGGEEEMKAGESNVELSEFPFVVVILQSDSPSDDVGAWTYHAAGTVLTVKIVLTTCRALMTTIDFDTRHQGLRSVDSIAVLGETTNVKSGTLRRAQDLTVHRHCISDNLQLVYDIGLIDIKQAFPSSFVPLKMSPVNEVESLLASPSLNCVTMGWDVRGTIDILTKANVVIMDKSFCKEQITRAVGNDTFYPRHHLCAVRKGFKYTCLGDYGSPLMCSKEDNSDWKMVGLVSLGVDCGQKLLPTTYTRITDFLFWERGRVVAREAGGGGEHGKTGRAALVEASVSVIASIALLAAIWSPLSIGVHS